MDWSNNKSIGGVGYRHLTLRCRSSFIPRTLPVTINFLWNIVWRRPRNFPRNVAIDWAICHLFSWGDGKLRRCHLRNNGRHVSNCESRNKLTPRLDSLLFHRLFTWLGSISWDILLLYSSHRGDSIEYDCECDCVEQLINISHACLGPQFDWLST